MASYNLHEIHLPRPLAGRNLQIFLIWIISGFISIFFSCSSSNIKQDIVLRFAVISNTYGESPYSGSGDRLNPVIEQINKDNPVFLVHLGDMVCGGLKWQGISNNDIDAQYRETFSSLSKLSPILYTVIGDSDLFGSSQEYYLIYSKRRTYCSFNYGSSHFLLLDSSVNGSVSEEQKEWIKKDLELYKDYPAIFVFIHHPLFFPAGYEPSESERCMDYETLHKYFTQYNVKTVFSGESSIFFQTDIDGISYINTGCCGFNRNDIAKECTQYYIIDYKNRGLSITPRSVF